MAIGIVLYMTICLYENLFLKENIMRNLHNYMEDLVLDRISSIIQQFNCCECEICREDIAAIALNNLPPQYFKTSKGQSLLKVNTLNQQFDANITLEVSKAISIVSKSPNHNI